MVLNETTIWLDDDKEMVDIQFFFNSLKMIFRCYSLGALKVELGEESLRK